MQRHNNYETDFYSWTKEQAALLRSGKLAEIDLEHIAEEIEEMGGSQRNALESRLEVLIMHLLKWELQPGRRSSSWLGTIKDNRRKINRLLKNNPSLKRERERIITEVYPDAVEAASDETGISEKLFPAACPYSIEQLEDKTFFPGTPHDFLRGV